MGLQNELFVLSFFATLTGVLGGEYCWDDQYPSSTRWCSYGCCGNLDRDCCDVDVALIVGMTVLSVIVVSSIIAIVCCCMRRRAAAGTIINTNPAMGSSIVVTNTGQTSMMTTGQPIAYNTQTYQPGVITPQPYAMGQPAAYPYGAPPAGAPMGGTAAPPAYGQVVGGGIENPGYDYKPMH